jgi:hypothetical protein
LKGLDSEGRTKLPPGHFTEPGREVLSDGRVLVGGDFTRYDGFTRHRLAWLDRAGRFETKSPGFDAA